MSCPRDRFLTLRHDQPHVFPSLLSADFGDLAREVKQLEAAQVRCVHLDVMDGCFVPNLTFGFPILEGLRKHTELLLDVHLMIREPARYVERFCAAGADCLTVHVEALERPREVLRQVRDLGVAAGITLNPNTPISTLDACWDVCDLVLVMSVPAGFGGQTFHEVALDKLSHARQRVGEEVLLEVDGGVNATTIQRCATAGAQLFVVGTAVFQSEDYSQAVRHLKQLASSG